MAKYTYECNTECVRSDLIDLFGYTKRFRVGDTIVSPREIDSPKFTLIDYTPDPPKTDKSGPAKAKVKE